LVGEGARDHLEWNKEKDSSVTFSLHGPIESTTTLGIRINSRLNFQPHLDYRLEKAQKLWGVMKRLGNSRGGMAPAAMRALLTGAIRPIFTYGAELWNRRDRRVNLEGMRRLEYQALRKITGSYHGASHDKLGWIAAVEPLQARLDHISILWAARSLRTGDPHIRKVLEEDTTGDSWHEGHRGANTKLDTPIAEAFNLTPISEPHERSYGDCQDTSQVPVLHAPMIDPEDPRSKQKGYWAGTIGGRMKEGWRMAYSDGTGVNEQAAAGFHSEDQLGRPDNRGGAFLGDLATVADAERKGIALALGDTADRLYILTDSQGALRTTLALSKEAYPRSRTERELKGALHKRRDQSTAITWIRGHIGIEGNTKADRLSAYYSYLGVTAMAPREATWEGVRNYSKARQRSERVEPGMGLRRADWNVQAPPMLRRGNLVLCRDEKRECDV